eukprot:51960_1
MSILNLLIFKAVVIHVLSSINAQIISPYDKLCATKSTHMSVDGTYSNPLWHPELNGSVFYNERTSQYLFPHVASGGYRYLMIAANPIFTTNTSLSCYCDIGSKPDNYIFNVDDCLHNWICLLDGKEVQNTNMTVVNCNDIRVTGCDTSWLNGIYVWKKFTDNYSVYYCKECNKYIVFDGSYLYGFVHRSGAYSGSYEWRTRGAYPLSEPWPRSTGWTHCPLGYSLSHDYLFNLENCPYWKRWDGKTWNMQPNMVVKKRVPCDSNALAEHCLYVDMYPSEILSTSNFVEIQNTNDNVSTYFYIFFNTHNFDCMYPTIKFEFEHIDYDSTFEYIRIINDNGSLITTCGNLSRNTCGKFETCIDNISIGVDNIEINKTYQILIVESLHVDALCPMKHNYSINAGLTLTCSIYSTETKNLTLIPTSISTTHETIPKITHSTTMSITNGNMPKITRSAKILIISVTVASAVLILVITMIIVFRRRLFGIRRYISVSQRQEGDENEEGDDTLY